MYPKNILCIILLVLLMSGVGQCADSRYEIWQANRPFTQAAWATHEAGGGGKLDLDYFHGSGLNTAYEGRCAYNADRPMPDFGGLPAIYFVYGNIIPDLDGFIADLEKARKKHNIVALMLGDEVVSSHGENGLTHYRQIRDWVANNPDPKIRSLLMMTCVPAGDKVTSHPSLLDYYNTTAERIKPDVVVPQFYPQFVKEDTGGTTGGLYYSSMEWLFNWTREKNVGFWACNRAWSSGPPVPSESSLRIQRFVSLAYGVRGTVDFLWVAGVAPTIQDAGYWHPSGPNPTVLYKRVAPINREIARLGPAMLQLTSVGAYHMDSQDDGDGVRHWSDSDSKLPEHLRRTRKLSNVSGPTNRNHLMVGFFRDAAGEEYFMVVNKDVDANKSGKELTAPVTLTFHPKVTGIQRLSRDTGKLENISVKNNYMFTLPGGTGDLFKFNTGKPFAGVQQMVVPRLAQSDPASGGTCCKLFENAITLKFDRDAEEVMADIRMLDDKGNEVGKDLSERFDRILLDKNTLVYKERGSVLTNKRQYAVKLHWADAKPVKIDVLRGDIDGDKTVSPKDRDAAAGLLGRKVDYHRADINSDGVISDQDVAYMDKMINSPKFKWSEDFEGYPVGPLSGNGGWVEAEVVPGTVLSKSWVYAPLSVIDGASPLGGSKRVCGKLTYNANDIVFHKGGGFDSVGILRGGFTTRVGRGASYQNTGFIIFNSTDKAGECGGIQIEHMRSEIKVVGTRGLKLGDGTNSVNVQGGQDPDSKGIKVEVVFDFEASKLIWQCEDVDNSKLYGPFEIGYTGTVKGLDALAIMADMPEAQIDDIFIRND